MPAGIVEAPAEENHRNKHEVDAYDPISEIFGKKRLAPARFRDDIAADEIAADDEEDDHRLMRKAGQEPPDIGAGPVRRGHDVRLADEEIAGMRDQHGKSRDPSRNDNETGSLKRMHAHSIASLAL